MWTPAQIAGVLEEQEYRVLELRFGLDRPANFEGDHWHLHVARAITEIARATDLEPAEARALLDRARARLLLARETRIRPALDDKILGAWNGLMIMGMSVAGRVLGEAAYVRSAERALDFVRERMFVDGRLLATCKDGRAHLNAYLDDHALLIDAVLALLECRWRDGDLDFAVGLAEILLSRFMDPEGGGFYFTSDDHEQLIHRPKPMADDAVPAGNGVAAFALGRLGHLLGETRYLKAAETAIRAGWEGLRRFPHAHNTLLDALEEHLYPTTTVVIRGTGAALERWHARATRHYAPRRMTIAIPAQAASLPGMLGERVPRAAPVAYVCRGYRCDAPITDEAQFERGLEASEVGAIASFDTGAADDRGCG